MNSTNTETNYRWYILTLAALTHTFSAAMPMMCLPVLFKEISEDLHLNLVQIGFIWGIVALPSILISLVGGVVGDRFGPRRTLTIACLLVGITGALRGLSIDFMTLAITVLLFGILRPVIPMNVHKTCGVWFSSRQLGLANGTVSMGMALGFMVSSMISATILSPWLGGWRNVLFFYGAISVIIGILWHITQPVPHNTRIAVGKPEKQSLRQTVSHVLRIKNVWLLSFALLGIGGCVQGTLGYLPLYLRGIGWTEAGADGALAAFHGVSMLCVIPLALWSDKLDSRKRVLIVAALMTVIGVGLLAFTHGMMIWVAVIIAGVVRDGFMAVFMTMVIEIKGVGAAYAGTAMGLVMSLLGLGSLLSPPVGNSLAGIAPNVPFIFWMLMAGAGLIALFLTNE